MSCESCVPTDHLVDSFPHFLEKEILKDYNVFFDGYNFHIIRIPHSNRHCEGENTLNTTSTSSYNDPLYLAAGQCLPLVAPLTLNLNHPKGGMLYALTLFSSSCHMAYSLSDYAKCPPTCEGVGDAMIHWIIVLGGVWALMNFKNHTLVRFYDKLLFSNIEMGFGPLVYFCSLATSSLALCY